MQTIKNETTNPLTEAEIIIVLFERCDILAEALRAAMDNELAIVRTNRDVYTEYVQFKKNLVNIGDTTNESENSSTPTTGL